MAERLNVEDILSSIGERRFTPKPFHSPEADCLHFYFEDTRSNAVRIDCWLTIYKASDDGRIIGFKLKNIKALLSRFDALGLDFRVSGKKWSIRLQTFFAFIPLVADRDDNSVYKYQDFIEQFGTRLKESVDLAA